MAVSTIIVNSEGLRIPAGFADLESFRQWARSDDFPERGRIDYVSGEVDIDISPEDLTTHGTPKAAILFRFHGIVVEEMDAGIVVTDRTRLSSPVAALSVEPDVLVILDKSIRLGRVKLIPKADGRAGRYVEVEGAADVVVECVSDSSVEKDTDKLVDLYHQAGIREYWVVDARGIEVDLTLYRWAPAGYVAVPPDGTGFRASGVLGRSFRLVRRERGSGLAVYRLEERA